MDMQAAAKFILDTGRPLEKSLYRYYFESGSKRDVIDALLEYQNPDGGFGHAIELDNWNPLSNPIATNDAIIFLYKADAFDEAEDMVHGITRYLASRDSFDEEKRRWLFAIDSNTDYPHATWWEKKGDGISGCNPTVSLAAFTACFGEDIPYHMSIVEEAVSYLETAEETGADELKCYILAYYLLKKRGMGSEQLLDRLRAVITKRMDDVVCKDIDNYGALYVCAPSDLISFGCDELFPEHLRYLADAERRLLTKLQRADGGFNIYWKWYTPFDAEFEQTKKWWRPRITLEKMIFFAGFGEGV